MNLLAILERVQAIARNGLFYTDSPWEKERCEQLLEIAVDGYEGSLGGPAEEIRAALLADHRQVTPKVGADAAIFNDAGELLLMERSDGSGWCLPCGWIEAWESPAEACIREVSEETGLDVEIDRLVGIFTRRAGTYGAPVTMFAVVHLCRVVGGELTLSHEGWDLKYLPIEAVTHWHANHRDYAVAAFESWQSGDRTAVSR